MTKATVKQEDTPFAIWDTCAITQSAAEQLVGEARESGKDLSEKEAFDLACRDQDLIDFEWEDMCDCLTELMNRINPDGCRWDARVRNFGWRSLDGRKDAFKAETGRELLQAVLPKTDCTFHVFDEGDQIRIRNWHHDSPVGNEYYVIEVHRNWVIKALYEVNEDTEEPLYWSNEDGWVDRGSATVFSDREKKGARLPIGAYKLSSRVTDPEITTAGEWEEVEE